MSTSNSRSFIPRKYHKTLQNIFVILLAILGLFFYFKIYNPTYTAEPTPDIAASQSIVLPTQSDADPEAQTVEAAFQALPISTATADYSSSTISDYYLDGTLLEPTYPEATQSITYCPLDDLTRPTCVYALLTQETRLEAQERGRQSINLDPVGWSRNSEVNIPALSFLEDSKDYNGWFWNRSHMLADSLGGAAVAENLITGTRTQNVGSTSRGASHTGGMAYGEEIARQYLDSDQAANCPLYYAAFNQYQDQELLPRSTTVEMQNCDNTVNHSIVVLNVANQWVVNYLDGSFAPLN